MKGKHFIVPYHVYPFDVLVSLGQTDTEVISILKRRGVVDDLDLLKLNGQGRCVMFEGGQTVIRMKHIPNCHSQYGYLQHEIFHAVDFLMNRIGMRLTYDSSEAYAYLVGYLTTEIFKRIPYGKSR